MSRMTMWRESKSPVQKIRKNTHFEITPSQQVCVEQKNTKAIVKIKAGNINVAISQKNKLPLDVQKITNSAKFNITIRAKYMLHRA